MSSGPPPAPETLLSTPLPCWHESLHAARSDLIVGLSPRSARIATGRPVPVGTPMFLELGRDAGNDAGIDAGIDAIAVASETDAFVVEFVTVDAGAAALIARALQAPQPPGFAAATNPAPTASNEADGLDLGAIGPAAVEDIPVVTGTPVVTERGWLDEVTPEPHELDWPSTTTPAATTEATAAPALQLTGVEAPDDSRETTARWPAARVARAATPPQWTAPSTRPTPTTTAPSSPPTWLGDATTEPTVPGPGPAPVEETARWPVARAVVSAPPPPTAPPPLSLDDAEDVVLEFTAPPRPAVVSRPLPAPEDAGIVEVDFSEFRDVLGVATFKTDAPQPIALQAPVKTPQPVAITLPRTPSMSRTLSAPGGSPFGRDAGPDPVPDATRPTVHDDAAATASVVEQWVVSSPGLPGPRLGHGGINEPLRSPATSSVSTMPAPFPIPMTMTPPPMLTPPTRATAAGPSPAPPAPQELPPISMDEHEVVTTPGGLARGVRRLD